MSSRNPVFIVHPARGGLDTTSPPSLLGPDQLVIADNIEYDTTGARKKRAGTDRYNNSQVISAGDGATFTAIKDYWRYGQCPEPVHKFVAHAGNTLYKDDGDGVWDIIDPALDWGNNGTVTNITIAQGFAVFSNLDGDAPKKWDTTTLSDLSVNAPAFAASVYHLRRLWGIDYSASHSRTWYTAVGDITDWTGVDTGTITFDEDDGDRLIGVSQPYQNRLYFFKGPNRGSVWNVSGNTPTTFVRSRMFSGAPCVSHASIITTTNDIYWVSRHGIHSLEATVKFGDTEEFFLSHPIQEEFRKLSPIHLKWVVGFYHPTRNIVGWALPESSPNNVVFTYNYVTKAWSVWRFSGFSVRSVMTALTPDTLVPRVYYGGYDGFVRAGDQSVKSDDDLNLSYTVRLRTPIIQRFGDAATELHEKQFYRLTTWYRTAQQASNTFLVQYWLDDDSLSTANKTVTQTQGGDLLGTTFIMGTSALGGRAESAFDEFVIEGRARSIQIDWSQNAAGQDLELYGYALTFHRGEAHASEEAS